MCELAMGLTTNSSNNKKKYTTIALTMLNLSLKVRDKVKVIETIVILAIANSGLNSNQFNISRYYNDLCLHPESLFEEIRILRGHGDFGRISAVVQRINATKRIELLALGGSITAGSYFRDFVSHLQSIGYEVIVRNHGHGGTGVDYTLYCVDFEQYSPDLVLIEFAVNDDDHPRYIETLIRRVLQLGSSTSPSSSFYLGPIVALINFSRSISSVGAVCKPKYAVHGLYYNLPLLDMCHAIVTCFGKGRVSKSHYHQFTPDGIHPFGPMGRPFLGGILTAWWKSYERAISTYVTEAEARHTLLPSPERNISTDSWMKYTSKTVSRSRPLTLTLTLPLHLPPPLYDKKDIGECRSCVALVDDARQELVPVDISPNGFRIVTRTKYGANGFQESYKRCWQSDVVGSSITFSFTGGELLLAVYQRFNGMGVLDVFLDGVMTRSLAQVSGYFGGYGPQSRAKGRTFIIPVLSNLSDAQHNITFVVSSQPANGNRPGHMTQIIALLTSTSTASGCSRQRQSKNIPR
eukprot:gene8231-16927_t